jgi:glycosyltransferase involved in cell wall biosynthesis
MAATDNRVIFTGFQRGDAVHTLFHHANGYVLPSELEGLPLSLLEAMSHGTTPIVSDIGPHRELLASVPGYDLFFKSHDVAGLTDRLNRMLAQPEIYRELGVRIQKFAEKNFSWDAITRLTEDLYFDALRGAPETAFDFPLGGGA